MITQLAFDDLPEPEPSNSRADQILARFEAFHRDNPSIWQLYKRFAFDLIKSGATRYSSDAIMHRIRWHVAVETRSDDSLKLNDHYTAYYSRMFTAVYPEHAAFFSRRKRPSADHPAYKDDIAFHHSGEANGEAQLNTTLRDLANGAR